MTTGLTFNDVLLRPQYSDINPNEIDISTVLKTIKLDIPIISAAMDTVSGYRMAIAMANEGGFAVIHRNFTFKEQLIEIKEAQIKNKNIKIAVAISPLEEYKNIESFFNLGVNIIVIDTAHGHTKRVIKATMNLKREYGDAIIIISGNVGTKEGTEALIQAGADVVKIGIGPGSICTTRIVAGVGIPQLTAIMDCFKVAERNNIPLIADGGICYSGDIVKALAAGAYAVMVGNLLAGTEEAMGEKVSYDGQIFKKYRGMGSEEIIKNKLPAIDRYNGKSVAEGVDGLVPYKGKVHKVVQQLVGGLKAGMGYIGAKNLQELREKAQFIRISPSSLRESHIHNIKMIKNPQNYYFPGV